MLDPNSKIGHKMRHKLRTMNDGDVEEQNKARLALLAWANEDKDTMNAHTKRRRENILYMWRSVLGSNPCNVPEVDLWTEAVVREYAPYFLTFRVRSDLARSGRWLTSPDPRIGAPLSGTQRETHPCPNPDRVVDGPLLGDMSFHPERT